MHLMKQKEAAVTSCGCITIPRYSEWLTEGIRISKSDQMIKQENTARLTHPHIPSKPQVWQEAHSPAFTGFKWRLQVDSID